MKLPASRPNSSLLSWLISRCRIAVRAGTHLCTTRNTHPRYPDLTDDRRRAFPMVPVGDLSCRFGVDLSLANYYV